MEKSNNELKKNKKKTSSKKVATSESKNTADKKPNRLSVFTKVLIGIMIVVSIGIYFGIKALIITVKYWEYTDKMETYGFAKLYNNEKATSIQKVSNAELIKVTVGTINNIKDISNIYYLTDKSKPDSQNWYNYSLYAGINDSITEKELDVRATYIDAVVITTNVLEGVLGEVKPSELKMSEKRLKQYTEAEQIAIAKAVTLGIIQNKNSALSNSKIVKGELNKLLIEIIEENALMYYKNKGNSDEKVEIVTDKKQMPENYKEYPYIISSIPKEIYELDYEVKWEPSFKTPKHTYKLMGYLYGQIDDMVVNYFRSILNVDYKTITNEKFLYSIGSLMTYKMNTNDVKKYVQYVKDNKITLQGEATPLLPIMYSNGEQYIIRTKITFKVINSDTEYNLLFGDESRKVKYNGNEITMYVDLPTGMTFNSNSLLISKACLARHIVKPTEQVVIE